VLSYHSLEDRLVKRVLVAGATGAALLLSSASMCAM